MPLRAHHQKVTEGDSDDSDGVPPALPPRLTRDSNTENWIKTADGLIIPPPPSRRPSGSSTASSTRTTSSSHTAARPTSTRAATGSNSQAQPKRATSTKRISAFSGNMFRRSLFGRSADTRRDSHVVDMDDSRRETMLMQPPPLPPRRGKRDLSKYMDDARYPADSLEKNLPRMPSKATVASTSSSNEGGYTINDNVNGGVGGEGIGYEFNNEKRAAGLPLLRIVDAWLARKYPRVYPYRHALYVSILLFFIGLLVIIICTAAGGSGGSGGSGDVGQPGLDLSGSGDGTYYDPSIGEGSCGGVYQNEDFVAALNAPQYGSYANPNTAPVCGKCIKVTGPKGTVKVKIVDKCPVCKNGDVDMSPAAFNEIADEAQGRVPITWEGC